MGDAPPRLPLPATALLREVGPRDGLQVERPLTVAQRLGLIEVLVAAGLRHVEAGSFVSAKAVPAMAGTAELFAALPRDAGVTYYALVPNARGAQLALQAGADALTVTLSACEVYNQRNIRMTIAQSLDAVAEIVALAEAAEVPVDAVVSCAFGSPYQGEIDPASVRALAGELRARGAAALTFADTTGMATPRGVRQVIELVGPDCALHLHETRGTGLLNAYAGLELGVARFDTSVGGLGGSPFAAGAAGNVATEDLLNVLDDLGVRTGVSLERLLEASRLLEGLIERPVASRVAHAGPRLAAPVPG